MRVAATQQRRMNSSSAQPRAGRVAAVTFAALSAVVLVTVATPPAQNAFFSFSTPPLDINKVKKDIVAAIDAEDAKRNDGTSIAPTLVRLAWHASGTYSIFDKTGGSNGSTMRHKPESAWGANAGLDTARNFVDAIVKKNPGLSTADAWTLAGGTEFSYFCWNLSVLLVVQLCSHTAVAIENMGGPVIPWRAGRKDHPVPGADNTIPDGRLPNPHKGCPAHAVGRCHPEASGFWGPWTRSESTFSNQFFVALLNEKWTEKKLHEGKPWTGPVQYESADGSIMMLPADLWLLQDKEFRKYVELYAKDEAAFFSDFAAAFSKLMELGVQF
jgi:cytochrome c peroxidase